MADVLTPAELSLGERLTESGKLDRPGFLRARKLSESGQGRLAAVLSHLGLVREADMASALADVADLKVITAEDFPDEAVEPDRFRGRFLKRARILPVRADGQTVRVAMADPLDERALQAVRLAVPQDVEVVVAEATVIDQAIERLYFASEAASDLDSVPIELEVDLDDDIEKLKGLASEAPVIRTVNGLIDEAVGLGASDIHVEPGEGSLGVRFRLDGRLVERNPLPPELTAAVISRIKIMARLDIAERRLPQDGRVQAAVRGRAVDLRISTMPTILGESAVVRILDRDSVALDFSSLGIGPDHDARLQDMLAQPNGIMLVTGPTGSGKTTTLYAGLSILNKPDVNILTVEDPIEYRLSGIKQIQVKPAIGLDFARVLRSMLRHDPDVILVGEIRDRETAEIAIQASLTGHLVLSTLHTNDAVSAIVRLGDMGVENYLLTSAISGIVAQTSGQETLPRLPRVRGPFPFGCRTHGHSARLSW